MGPAYQKIIQESTADPFTISNLGLSPNSHLNDLSVLDKSHIIEEFCEFLCMKAMNGNDCLRIQCLNKLFNISHLCMAACVNKIVFHTGIFKKLLQMF